MHEFAVDENRHVLAKRSAFVNHVSAQPRILFKDVCERRVHRVAVYVNRRAGNVSLQVLGEINSRHDLTLTARHLSRQRNPTIVATLGELPKAGLAFL